jgi:hypothetical protein
MKKYIKPSVTIYNVEIRCAILDGSGTPNVTSTPASASTNVLSRDDNNNNLWEDNEDDK